MAKKKVKRKLNLVRTFIFILIVYIIVCLFINLYKQPVKHYEISGNEYVTDNEILKVAGLDKYPSYISLFNSKIKKKIESLKLVKSVKISYGLNFKLKIKIEENTPILIDKTTNKVVLKDGTKIDNDFYVGLPILLNNTPDTILKKFVLNLSEVDSGIRYMINEIEYAPSYNSDGDVIDENRFLLSMNDKNMVYITLRKIERLNKYIDIISTNKITTSGTLYLDGEEERYPFKYAKEVSDEQDED